MPMRRKSMPNKPTLLFLHGVGTGDLDGKWRHALDEALTRVGYPGMSPVTVIAPKYAKGLKGVDDRERLPKVTVKQLRSDEAKAHEREVERRRAAMEARLGVDEPGNGWKVANILAPPVTKLVKQANNYTKEPEIRAWVLRRIINALPESGRVVIVGHSLGSVIAADVLRRLPPKLEVVGLVTIGSPLAHRAVQTEPFRKLLADPPPNVQWWVNFRSTADVVPTGRGVSTVIPWVLDRQVRAINPVDAHFATTYLSDSAVATAIGYGLFGSQSKELVAMPKGIDIPLDVAETLAHLALRYGHLILKELDEETKPRYADALRQSQSTTVERIRERNLQIGRPMPSAIEQLMVDLSDPTSAAPTPDLPVEQPVEDVLLPLLTIAETNIIQPFEIEVGKKERQKAMVRLTIEMGLGSHVGNDVFAAIEGARKALKGPTNWLKWAALGLGGAAAVAATGGLALSAAPGVVGAAGVTSALAAFGPGGMIGGLLTAGTLMGAGGGGIALGLTTPGTSAEAVEAVVSAHLAAALLRELQGLDQDPTTWTSLIEAEVKTARELSQLEALSDDSAPSLKELERKLAAFSRAIECLRKRGLGPADGELR